MGEEPSVLIVEEQERRSELRKLVTAARLAVAEEAGFGGEATVTARDAKPDVVILGMEEPVVRPLRTIEALTLTLPNLPVLVVSSLGDREHLRKAMQAGARDFLVKPVRPQDLQAAVAGLLEGRSRRQAVLKGAGKSLTQGEVISVFGVKGGIGKTSIAVNLAAAIAKQTKRSVGVLDLDLQLGDTAVVLNFLPGYTVADAAASVDRLEPELLRSLMWADPSGILLLPAPLRPEEAEEITAEHVKRILAVMAQAFDYVLVDTPPMMSDLVAASLDLSTLVLLLTTQEVLALRRTKVALQMLRSWGYSEDRVKLLLNHAYSMNSAAVGDIESALDYKVFWHVPNDPAVAASVKVGLPFVTAYPNSRVGRSVEDLARSLCGLEQRQSGFVGKLFRR